MVCCDGGADEYIRRGHTPDVIIGDGDSLSDENRRKFGHILHRISDQEMCIRDRNYIYLKSAKNIELYKYQHFIERYIHIILYPETIMLV